MNKYALIIKYANMGLGLLLAMVLMPILAGVLILGLIVESVRSVFHSPVSSDPRTLDH